MLVQEDCEDNMAGTWDEVLHAAQEYNKKYNPEINPTEANILVKRIMTNYDTVEEYYAIQNDAITFLKSDASLEDKQYVRGHLESLGKTISAIEKGYMHLPLRK